MNGEVKENNDSTDTDVRITHCNNLWVLYRVLSDNITMTEEEEKKLYHSLFDFLKIL